MSLVIRSLAAGICAVTLAWVSGSANATIVVQTLDDFGSDHYQYASGVDGSWSSGIASVSAGVLSGTGRSVFAEKTGGSTNQFLRVEALDDNTESAFSVSRASNISGNVLVQWDGENGPDPGASPVAFDPTSNLKHLLNLDLTAGGATGLFVRILNTDLAGQQLKVTLFGADSSVASELLVALPTVPYPGPHDALFAFADFTLRAGASGLANPSAITAMTLEITGPPGSDLSLDMVGTYAVPEPATASILGLSGLGLLVRLGRSRSKAGRTG